MLIQNKVQLITYPDSLGGNLESLKKLLFTRFTDIFGGVHILPPFPSSADRGFAPLTYFEIDPRFGSWQDIRMIGEQFDVVLDLMVNHISRKSSYFQDFIQIGRRSKYADMFITLDKIWPKGEPVQKDVSKIFLRRPEHPFSDIMIEETGQVERVWSSFGTRDWSEQMDLDVNSPITRQFFRDVLTFMSRNSVNIVRLDAIAYITKKPGTNCFFVEPDIYAFLNWIRSEAQAVNIELLPEVHAHYSIQSSLAEHNFWIYDFILPMLVLQASFSRNSRRLQRHLKRCPRRQFTMLDAHDGIPVQPDLNGVIPVDEAQQIVQICLERGANLNRIFSVEHRLRPDFDAHQINCTYYSALDRDDDAYITARAIQFFSPGIPQIYYVGLLAGENDQRAVAETGEGRAINRHNYSLEEVDQALEKPVVQRLLRLIRFRNELEAFNGDFVVHDTEDGELKLSWSKDEASCTLHVDMNSARSIIEYRNREGILRKYVP